MLCTITVSDIKHWVFRVAARSICSEAGTRFLNVTNINVMLQCLVWLFESLRWHLQMATHNISCNKHRDQTVLGKADYRKSTSSFALSLLMGMKSQYEIWGSSAPCSLVGGCRKTRWHISEDCHFLCVTWIKYFTLINKNTVSSSPSCCKRPCFSESSELRQYNLWKNM